MPILIIIYPTFVTVGVTLFNCAIVGLTFAFGFIFGHYFVVKTLDFFVQPQHNDAFSFFSDASAHPITTTTIDNKLNKLYISCKNYSGFSPATMG